MLIAFETDSSKALEDYLEEYQHPENMLPSFKNILKLYLYSLYFERKVYRVDRIVIFSQKGYIEEISKYVLYFLVTGCFIAIFFNLYWLLIVDIILTIPMLCFNFSKYHLLAKIRKLRSRGHTAKIGFVSSSYIINKLLFKVENGTTRSV